MKGVEMVGLVTLTSGALIAGFGIYQYLTQSARALQPKSITVPSSATRATEDQEPAAQMLRTNAAALPAQTKVDVVPRTIETKATLRRGFSSSTISLGLASTGLFFFPPLQYASVPVLIYMGAPSARQAYDLLYEKGRPGRALVETAVLAVCLGGGWYLVGSLGFWLYYLGRTAQYNHALIKQRRTTPWALPQSARRIDGVAEVIVPRETLQCGDEVRVETSDIVPVDGIISDGVAWVQPAGATDLSAYCLKRTGDRLVAADVVIAGRISLRMQKAT